MCSPFIHLLKKISGGYLEQSVLHVPNTVEDTGNSERISRGIDCVSQYFIIFI